MKQYKLLALTLGGALMLGALAPTSASADSVSDIADLKKMVMEIQQAHSETQKAHDAEITRLKQQINNLQKPVQVVDSQGVNVTELKQQVEELQDLQSEPSDSLMDRVSINGFISQGYLISDKHNWGTATTDTGTFQFNEMGLTVQSNITEKLRVGVQLFSYDYGDNGNNKISLDWAFGDYAWKDWLGIRAGKLKIPFGLVNESRDVDSVRTSIFIPQAVYGFASMRNLLVGMNGASIYGFLPYGFSYTAQYGELDGDNIKEYVTTQNGIEMDQAGSDDIVALQVQWEAPFEIPFTDSLLLAYSRWQVNGMILSRDVKEILELDPPGPAGLDLYAYDYSLQSEMTQLFMDVYSLQYIYSDFIFTGELKKQTNSRVVTVTGTAPFYLNSQPESTTKKLGWYLSASYRINNWLELGSTYSEFYNDTDDKTDDLQHIKDTCVTTKFDINENWLVKAEVHFMNGLFGVDAEDNDADWKLFALKTSYSF